MDKTHIEVTTGGLIKAQESLQSIQDKIESAMTKQIPLIAVTDERGIEHRINASRIVEFYPPSPEAAESPPPARDRSAAHEGEQQE